MQIVKDFKAFVARGNVVELAVAVVIGAAFGAVVTAIVADLITPLIGMAGGANFATLHFTVNHSEFLYGKVIDATISFLAIAAVIFFAVVKPLNTIQARRAKGQESPDPTARQCPECLSDIPLAASRCAFCTAAVPPVVSLALTSTPAAPMPPGVESP